MHWFDLSGEEDWEQEAVHELMRKFAKLWQVLFRKYAGTAFQTKGIADRGNFEVNNRMSHSISLAELIKFSKDHDLMPRLASKDQVA